MSRSYRNQLQRTVTDQSNSQQWSSDEVFCPQSHTSNIHGHNNAPGPSRQNESSPLIFHEQDSKEYASANSSVDDGAQLLESLEKTVQELVKSRRREASLIMENQQLRMAVAGQNTESMDASCLSTGQMSHVATSGSDVPSLETGRISQLPPPGSDVLALETRQISQVPNSASLLLPLDTERVCQLANLGPGNAVNHLIDIMKSQTISELQAQAERLQTNMLSLEECNQKLQLRLRLSSSAAIPELSDVSTLSLTECPPDERALRFRRRLLNTITQLLKDKARLLELIDGLQKDQLQQLLALNPQVLSFNLSGTCQGRQNEAVQLSKLDCGLSNVGKSQTGNNVSAQDLLTTVQKLTNDNSQIRSKNKALTEENNCLQKRLETTMDESKHCVQKFKDLSEQWNRLYNQKLALEQETKALKSENCDLKRKLFDLPIDRCSTKNVLKPSNNNECAALHESVPQHVSLSVSDGQRVGSDPSLLMKRKVLCRDQPENEMEEQASEHRSLPIFKGSGRASRRDLEHVKCNMEDNAELRCSELAVCGEKLRSSDGEMDSWMLSKKLADLEKDNAFLKEELEKCTRNNVKLEITMEKMKKEKHVLEDYLHVVQKVTKEPFLEGLQVHGARSCRSNTDMPHNTSDNLASSRIKCAVTYDEDKQRQQQLSNNCVSGFSKDSFLENHLNLSQQLAEMQRKLAEEIKAERKVKSEVQRCYLSSKRSRQSILEDPSRDLCWRNLELRAHSPGPSQHASPVSYCYNTH